MGLNGASVLGNEAEILHRYPRFDWPHGPPLPDLSSLGIVRNECKVFAGTDVIGTSTDELLPLKGC
jgi:hypothetical protein